MIKLNYVPIAEVSIPIEVDKMNPRQLNRYNRIKEIVESKGGVMVSSYFVDDKTLIKYRCIKAHDCEVWPNHLIRGRNCKVCANRCHIQGGQKFKERVEAKGGKVLGEYVNTKTYIKVQCEHGHTWDVVPLSITGGSWCQYCLGTTPEQAYQGFVEAVAAQGGTILGKYVNTKTPVRVRCHQGHEWDPSPTGVKQGQWCLWC